MSSDRSTQSATTTSGPTPSGAQLRARRLRAPFELAVGAASRPRTRRPPPRAPRAPAPRTVVRRRVAGTSAVGAFHSASSCAARGSGRIGSSPTGALGRATASQEHLRSARHTLDRRLVEQVGVVLELGREAVRSLETSSVRSNSSSSPLSSSARCQTDAGQLEPAVGRSGSRTSPGTAACATEVAVRLQRLDQLLERHVLMGVGAQSATSRTAAEQLAERRIPGRSVRSTRVLTKKPISPRSRRGAVGDRRADDHVVLAGVAGAAAPRSQPAAS